MSKHGPHSAATASMNGNMSSSRQTETSASDVEASNP